MEKAELNTNTTEVNTEDTVPNIVKPKNKQSSKVRPKIDCHQMQVKGKSKWYRLLYNVDRQISINFAMGDIRTRPVNSNGLWCCLLLPSILFSYYLTTEVSLVYKLMTYLALAQLFYSGLFITFVYVSCLILKENFAAGCVVSAMIATSLVFYNTEYGVILSLTFATLSVYPYYYLIKTLLTRYPLTFTLGEAMVVSQAVVLFSNAVLADLYGTIVLKVPNVDDKMQFVKAYIYATYSAVILILSSLYLTKNRRDLYTLSYIFGAGAIYALIILHISRGVKCIPEFIDYILLNNVRLKLCGFWLALVALAVAVIVNTSSKEKASTSMRKSFHILASLVFVTGIHYDVYFMMLAAALVFGLVILIEAIRLIGVEPLSTYLQSAFNCYSDEKDCGVFAMTPIYLYVGLACPLALVPWSPASGHELELLSGVLAIGVGDTAASVFGARYGINKWPNGQRTVEGTAFNICTQLIVAYVLYLFDVITARNCLFRTLISATVSGLVEAQVNQVDNLILPLITILAFQFTRLLA